MGFFGAFSSNEDSLCSGWQIINSNKEKEIAIVRVFKGGMAKADTGMRFCRWRGELKTKMFAKVCHDARMIPLATTKKSVKKFAFYLQTKFA